MNVADLIEELTYRFVVSAPDDTQARANLVALRVWAESQLAHAVLALRPADGAKPFSVVEATSTATTVDVRCHRLVALAYNGWHAPAGGQGQATAPTRAGSGQRHSALSVGRLRPVVRA